MIFQPQNNRDILFSTIFLSLSYPPSPFGFFIYFAFIPVIRASIRLNPRQAFVCGYVIGLLSNMILLHWIAIYNPWYYLFFIPLNALQIAVFMWIISLLAKRNRFAGIVIFPFLWTSIEYIRELGPYAFTWLNIGYTQSNFLYLIQYAEYTGTLGIVFWICLVNMILILLWDYRQSGARLALFLTLVLLLFIFPFIHANSVLSQETRTSGFVGAYVQPNIESQRKWAPSFREKNLWVLLAESQKLLSYLPDLIVWPETALPYYYRNNPQLQNISKAWATNNNTNIITGTLDKEGSQKYNTAILIDGIKNNDPDAYRKLKPVPVAETAFWPFTNDTNSITPGKDHVVFNFNISDILMSYDDYDWRIEKRGSDRKELKCATIICFESAFAYLVQEMVNRGADLLIIITNDESFGYSAQPYQHLQIARMRAIENRRSVIHCANSGISAFIDPFGNIFHHSELFENWHSVQPVPVWTKIAFFTRYGKWLGWFMLGVTLISGAAVIIFVRLK